MTPKTFRQLQPGSHIYTVNPFHMSVVNRVVKSVEGYNHAGNPTYVKITFYESVQNAENITKDKIIELATKVGKEQDIQTKTLIVPGGSYFIHTVEVLPQPYCTNQEHLQQWLNKQHKN